MSTFSKITAALAFMAPFVAAFTTPSGDPNGNPISQPGLNSVVPVGENYTIQWKPTTDGTVSLVLLKGPSTNMQVVAPIAEKIENNGIYVWSPSNSLQPGPTTSTGYGIQIICDSNGQYQYSTQFGIDNPSPSTDDNTSSVVPDDSDSSTISGAAPLASASGYLNSTIALPSSTAATLTTSAVPATGTATNTPVKPSSTMVIATASSAPSSAAVAIGANMFGLAALAGAAVLAL